MKSLCDCWFKVVLNFLSVYVHVINVNEQHILVHGAACLIDYFINWIQQFAPGILGNLKVIITFVYLCFSSDRCYIANFFSSECVDNWTLADIRVTNHTNTEKKKSAHENKLLQVKKRVYGINPGTFLKQHSSSFIGNVTKVNLLKELTLFASYQYEAVKKK